LTTLGKPLATPGRLACMPTLSLVRRFTIRFDRPVARTVAEILGKMALESSLAARPERRRGGR
jgi:hypothetical protein